MTVEPTSERLADRRFAAVLGLVALLSVLSSASDLRTPLNWIGGDRAQYVMQATNLVEGQPFEDTGYIYNPRNPELGPRAYPPGWPVLLAPVIAAFDGAVAPIRATVLLFFATCLVLCGYLFRTYLTDPLALGGAALVGLNPQLPAAGIGSDVPFLLFLLGAWFLIEWRPRGRPWLHSVLVGLGIFAAYSVRTVGALLAPALLAADLLRARRFRPETILSLSIFTALFLAQYALTTGTGSYFDQLQPTVPVVVSNLANYARAFSTLWESGAEQLWIGELVRKALTLLFIVLAGLGFLRRCIRPTMMEFYVVLYVVLIISWPAFQGLRFLIPVLPATILYALLSVEQIVDWYPKTRWALLTVVVGLPLLSYGTFRLADPGPNDRYFVDTPESLELIAFIEGTPRDAVFVFVKPRVLSLLTDRRAAANHDPATDEELLSLFREVGADYLILGPPEFGAGRSLAEFVNRHPQNARSIFVNEEFEVFTYIPPER